MSEYDELLARVDIAPLTPLGEEFVHAIRAQSKRIAELSGDLAIEKGFHERDMQLLEQAQSRLAAVDAYRGEAEKVTRDLGWPALPTNTINALLAARMEGAEAEREACAKIADQYKGGDGTAYDPFNQAGEMAGEIASAIRARKDTP